MIAADLLTDAILPLNTTDTGAQALSVMIDFYLRHLPVVKGDQLVGLISEEDILDQDPVAEVGTYQLHQQPPAVRKDDHLYDVLKLLAGSKLSVIPVVDDKGGYEGMITTEDVLRFFAETGSFKDPGSILVLSMTRHDYSLAEIARIVESEGLIVLSSFVQTSPNTNEIEVTIKLNSEQVGAIVATFERFDYTITASFNERALRDGLQDRYDSLIHYLNI